jgi:uncharacterized phage protein (TIGR02218 family)
MKRLMPASLITFLQQNPNCIRADLFLINLPNGQVLTTTDGQFDIAVAAGTSGYSGAAQTFRSTKYGMWSRGPITSEAAFNMNANTMTLTCAPQQGAWYKGMNVGILQAAVNNLFDAATVTVYTAYMPLGQYGNISAGLETKFYGTITKINDINRVKVEFECADPLYLLNLKVPTRIIQSNCPWSFCDANCGLTASSYTTNFTAASGTTQWVMIPSTTFSQSAGYFTQGVVTCTAGANAGLSQTVKLHDTSGHLELTAPWLLTPAVGDSFSVIAGCSKTMTQCSQQFNNLIHFGGMPYVPVPSQAI